MSIQTRNNNLNYLIEPTFTKVNRLYHLKMNTETMMKMKVLAFLLKNIMYQKLK